MKVPVVDYDLCVGCETCAVLCPEVFEMRDDGKAYVIGPDKCDTCDCQEAIDNCPAEAISWGEE
ncbi:MAG: ferredoxin [Nitrospirae bacterium]|nr:MAG: ferredoxin [Nitrospirota bacterium]